MPVVTLTADDITPFVEIETTKLAAMIEDVVAMAVSVAPCIADDAFAHDKAARAILRGAVLRWHAADSGAITQQAAGPFSQTIDSTTRKSGLLWPSEIAALQDLCRNATGGDGSAFAVDTLAAPVSVAHADICSIWLAPAAGCSCGAWLAQGSALWERA
ncbi:hypothetical protein MYK68_14005 [Gordonia sp. PP30]|uniref:hypothetical protein n=1 Tax=Gordonia sp. PP30 TaxID=2935861 RepID=UPI001FFF26FA|nr:hypothetical protein [Gordonia sp. PP30]UQE73844.1 hypothetical protein MYK68_14005 [Gordonia sp. PP30]